jgi:splicing factor U2AF 65 kDa subunit
MEDVQEECSNYGTIDSVVIPRAGQAGVGKVLVKYNTVEQAQAAGLALAGRQFAARVVKAEYHDVARFDARDYA